MLWNALLLPMPPSASNRICASAVTTRRDPMLCTHDDTLFAG